MVCFSGLRYPLSKLVLTGRQTRQNRRRHNDTRMMFAVGKTDTFFTGTQTLIQHLLC